MNRRIFLASLSSAVLFPVAPGVVPAMAKTRKIAYQGAEVVEFLTPEKRGTVIVNTHDRAL
jgi:hypothetical protein